MLEVKAQQNAKEEASKGRKKPRISKDEIKASLDGIREMSCHSGSCYLIGADGMATQGACHCFDAKWIDNEQFRMTMDQKVKLSRAFVTKEELAHYLADHNVSTFGYLTASYEEWLHMIRLGSAPSLMITQTGELKSGVEALSHDR